ncbi:MAG: hypothetical protein H0T52_10400, partial [Lautropia sp.]|nr:hypothetical protein [Lautropia sp.]
MTADPAACAAVRLSDAPASPRIPRGFLQRHAVACTAVAACLVLLAPGRAMALDLLQAFEAAQRHDAQLNSTRLQLAAVRERLPQARAGLRPSIGAAAAANAGRYDADVGPARSFDNVNGGINLSFPLYRPANTAVLDQT